MKVSIITPVYNGAKFLRYVEESIFKQSYVDWEWIIVDDCSTDDSWKLIEEIANKDNRVRIFKNSQNLKAGLTRNFAISKAEGRFIAFLDSDDVWQGEKLEKQLDFMLKNNYSFTFTAYNFINEIGDSIKKVFYVSKRVTYKELLKENQIGCLTVIYDTQKLGKLYMSDHARKQDYALWLSILKDKEEYAYGLNEVLSSYRVSKNQATSKKHKLIIKHFTFLKETQNLGNLQAGYYTLSWMVRGFVKHVI